MTAIQYAVRLRTYITSYQNARSRIARLTRDEILEELVKTFIEANHLDDQEESGS